MWSNETILNSWPDRVPAYDLDSSFNHRLQSGGGGWVELPMNIHKLEQHSVDDNEALNNSGNRSEYVLKLVNI